MLAKGNRSPAVTDACKRARRLLPRLDRRPGRAPRPGLHQEGRGARVPRARHGGGLEDRGRRLPGVHRGRRQGQRLLRRPALTDSADPNQSADLRLASARASWRPRHSCSRHSVSVPPLPCTYNTYMANKTISIPDDVVPIIDDLGMPFSKWVTDRLRRHAAQSTLSFGQQLLADAALSDFERPTAQDCKAVGERIGEIGLVVTCECACVSG